MHHADMNAVQQEMESTYRHYLALASWLDVETGLGGKLLFAGEPTEAAIHLIRAANIAGAASLAGSMDAAALRRTMREGALDFVVTTLDEALRILKNEIRKKQPVAVGVTLARHIMAREMLDRGVQPDLLAPAIPESEAFISRGATKAEAQPLPAGTCFSVLPLPRASDQARREFEESILNSLAPNDHVNCRWVRMSARYLPSAARQFRSLVLAKPQVQG
jgi:hypothetical protein